MGMMNSTQKIVSNNGKAVTYSERAHLEEVTGFMYKFNREVFFKDKVERKLLKKAKKNLSEIYQDESIMRRDLDKKVVQPTSLQKRRNRL